MSDEGKVRDNRLRRAAERQGLTVRKTRRRDPRALDYGRYWLQRGEEVVLGGTEGVSVDDVEAYLNR